MFHDPHCVNSSLVDPWY